MTNISVPDFIRLIIDKLDLTITVNNAVYDPIEDLTTFEVCNTHHISICTIITINGDSYEVVDFVLNKSITVKGDLTAETLIEVTKPYFWHGTPLQVTQVLSNIRSYKDKLPMVWLVEPYTSYTYEDKMSKLALDVNCTLMFVLPIANEDWCVEEQYDYLIRPIDNLISQFRECLYNSTFVENFNGKSRMIHRINMGELVSKNGRTKPLDDNIKRILEELITATEYSPAFAIKKNFQCCKE